MLRVDLSAKLQQEWQQAIGDTGLKGILANCSRTEDRNDDMPGEIQMCPLCGWDAQVTHLGDTDLLKCEMCGEFKIVRSLLATPFADPESQEAKELLPYLRAHTRRASEQGDIVTLDTRNWKPFALLHKDTPISRKTAKLLEFVASRSKPGIAVKINPAAEAPIVDAASITEMRYLLRHLVSIGYLDEPGGGNYLVSVNGWKQIEGVGPSGTPGKCFVAMWFHDSLKDAYDNGIYLAVKADCKMEPVKMDLVPHNDNIVDKIISEIRSCQFMVADFTGHRGGVYFEAGFAKGLGREVIWTCREDDFKNIHFDIAQFSHIIWTDPADLREKLAYRIKATIPGAV